MVIKALEEAINIVSKKQKNDCIVQSEGFLNLVSFLKNRFVPEDLFFCVLSLVEVPGGLKIE